MKWLQTTFLFLLTTGALLSCDPVTTEEKSMPDVNDSTEITDITADTTIFSVADALAMPVGMQICVRGYIVGCIKGSVISGALFQQPFNGVASNLLIADDSTEQEPYNCMPVELKNNTVVREQLNLVAHPELLHHKVILKGTTQTYFRQTGLKNVTHFYFPESSEQSADTTINIVFPIG